MVQVTGWGAQDLQNKLNCDIVIDGVEDWKLLLQDEVELTDEFWVDEAGGSRVSIYDYLATVARLNDTSFEREIFGHLMALGYMLEELEVEFTPGSDRGDWGVCVWKKDHPDYHKPDQTLAKFLTKTDPYTISLFVTKFDTEHAGEQTFSLASMQMLGAAMVGQKTHFLFHKTLLFRRARFSQPQAQSEAA